MGECFLYGQSGSSGKKKIPVTEIITTTQNWTVPDTVKSVFVRIFGGGGGGHEYYGADGGGGGGGGYGKNGNGGSFSRFCVPGLAAGGAGGRNSYWTGANFNKGGNGVCILTYVI